MPILTTTEIYFKYVVTVPEEIISELGGKEKQELEPKVDNGKLVFTERKCLEREVLSSTLTLDNPKFGGHKVDLLISNVRQ